MVGSRRDVVFRYVVLRDIVLPHDRFSIVLHRVTVAVTLCFGTSAQSMTRFIVLLVYFCHIEAPFEVEYTVDASVGVGHRARCS